MATVKTKPASLSSLRQAAALVKKEAVKVDANRDGKVSRAEVERYAKSLRNKQLGNALVVAHGLGSRSMNGASTISVDQLKTGADLAMGYVKDRDANFNGRIDAGAELRSAEKLKSFQALAALAENMTLGQVVDRGMATLKTGLGKANNDALNDLNRGFGVEVFPKGTADRRVFASVADWDEIDVPSDDLDPRFTGKQAVTRFLASLGEERDELYADTDDAAEARAVKRGYDTAIDAMRTYLEGAGLKDVKFLVHDIAEDGDTQHLMLLGTRPDGSRVALSYSNNPF